jgi:hypothetical protein
MNNFIFHRRHPEYSANEYHGDAVLVQDIDVIRLFIGVFGAGLRYV